MFHTILFLLCIVTLTHAINIQTLVQLNEFIANQPNKKIGFLSAGNFNSVKNELNKNAEPIYYENTTALHTAVRKKEIIAGLLSGTPENSSDFNVFASLQINSHAMMVRKGNTVLLNALDASIIRIIERGEIEIMAENNAPYNALISHSCAINSKYFDWPSLTPNTKICVAALGPYHWGKSDGDYTRKPYIGFWPDFYREIENEFRIQYNITFERKWFKTSSEVLNAILDESCDTTEPYMLVGSTHDNQSRKTRFDLSCTTTASQSQYFTLKTVEPSVSTSTIIVIAVLAVCTVILFATFAIMVYNEKIGNPLFEPFLEPSVVDHDIEMKADTDTSARPIMV